MLAPLTRPIRMVVKQTGPVRLHTFISSFSDGNIANATHIVESDHSLVLVDGQFLAPYARQFRSYADSLGKPIERVYLSHRHPDHWFGLGAAFTDAAIYALPETVDFLKEHGADSRDDHWKMGDLAPDSVPVPQGAVGPGEESIDGLTYVFDRVIDTEIDSLLTIRLPDLGVHIVQDLVYSGTHLYLTQDIGHWIAVLDDLLLSDTDLFLPGHGLPAGKDEVARNVEYLSAAGQAIANGLAGDAFKTFMLERYPDRKCPGIFDIYLPRLFGGAREY
jgi:glyoxylase-like metal-dependent hydrolase (beta-lactamase superfamily II)